MEGRRKAFLALVVELICVCSFEQVGRRSAKGCLTDKIRQSLLEYGCMAYKQHVSA
jgi:hypothetical protein